MVQAPEYGRPISYKILVQVYPRKLQPAVCTAVEAEITLPFCSDIYPITASRGWILITLSYPVDGINVATAVSLAQSDANFKMQDKDGISERKSPEGSQETTQHNSPMNSYILVAFHMAAFMSLWLLLLFKSVLMATVGAERNSTVNPLPELERGTQRDLLEAGGQPGALRSLPSRAEVPGNRSRKGEAQGADWSLRSCFCGGGGGGGGALGRRRVLARGRVCRALPLQRQSCYTIQARIAERGEEEEEEEEEEEWGEGDGGDGECQAESGSHTRLRVPTGTARVFFASALPPPGGGLRRRCPGRAAKRRGLDAGRNPWVCAGVRAAEAERRRRAKPRVGLRGCRAAGLPERKAVCGHVVRYVLRARASSRSRATSKPDVEPISMDSAERLREADGIRPPAFSLPREPPVPPTSRSCASSDTGYRFRCRCWRLHAEGPATTLDPGALHHHPDPTTVAFYLPSGLEVTEQCEWHEGKTINIQKLVDEDHNLHDHMPNACIPEYWVKGQILKIRSSLNFKVIAFCGYMVLNGIYRFRNN
ncbi:hypothetical protein EI555_010596, partial [Monodon monoceros]